MDKKVRNAIQAKVKAWRMERKKLLEKSLKKEAKQPNITTDNFNEDSDIGNLVKPKIDSLSISKLERDDLIVNGLFKQVKLIEDSETGIRDKDHEYLSSLNDINNYRKRVKEANLNKVDKSLDLDKTYSSWALLNKYCGDKINN